MSNSVLIIISKWTWKNPVILTKTYQKEIVSGNYKQRRWPLFTQGGLAGSQHDLDLYTLVMPTKPMRHIFGDVQGLFSHHHIDPPNIIARLMPSKIQRPNVITFRDLLVQILSAGLYAYFYLFEVLNTVTDRSILCYHPLQPCYLFTVLFPS